MNTFLADSIADSIEREDAAAVAAAQTPAMLALRAKQSAARAAANAARVPTIRAIGTDDGLNETENTARQLSA